MIETQHFALGLVAQLVFVLDLPRNHSGKRGILLIDNENSQVVEHPREKQDFRIETARRSRELARGDAATQAMQPELVDIDSPVIQRIHRTDNRGSQHQVAQIQLAYDADRRADGFDFPREAVVGAVGNAQHARAQRRVVGDDFGNLLARMIRIVDHLLQAEIYLRQAD